MILKESSQPLTRLRSFYPQKKCLHLQNPKNTPICCCMISLNYAPSQFYKQLGCNLKDWYLVIQKPMAIGNVSPLLTFNMSNASNDQAYVHAGHAPTTHYVCRFYCNTKLEQECPKQKKNKTFFSNILHMNCPQRQKFAQYQAQELFNKELELP